LETYEEQLAFCNSFADALAIFGENPPSDAATCAPCIAELSPAILALANNLENKDSVKALAEAIYKCVYVDSLHNATSTPTTDDAKKLEWWAILLIVLGCVAVLLGAAYAIRRATRKAKTSASDEQQL
jgi:hypothetical protein